MSLDPTRFASTSCSLPFEADRITLAHGAGAGASGRLFDDVIHKALANPALDERHDGALLELESGRIAFTTDSFVVSPLEFPGGDIGSLAVHGTVNDLAMCGAAPRALSLGLVLEEGLPLAVLERILDSLARAARAAGVPIATGDTKVVERGKGDELFINTSGIGVVPRGREIGPTRVAEGDAILVSGPIAEHGVAVLSVREGLAFETRLTSDSQPLHELVATLLEAVPDLHCLRDPTRGGLGASLCEIAAASGRRLCIDEASIPLADEVRGACELLGLDPLFLASEGRCVAFVPEARAETALAALRAHPAGRGATRIGQVEDGGGGVSIATPLGGRRRLVLPAGEPLPRIC